MAPTQVSSCKYCEIFNLPAGFGASYIRNANTSMKILKLLTLFFLLFLQSFFLLIPACSIFVVFFRLINWKISCAAFISTFRNRHRVVLWTAVRQDITKIVNFFHKIRVSFQYSLLNQKFYKFIKSEILHRHFIRAMVKRFILHL